MKELVLISIMLSHFGLLLQYMHQHPFIVFRDKFSLGFINENLDLPWAQQ